MHAAASCLFFRLATAPQLFSSDQFSLTAYSAQPPQSKCSASRVARAFTATLCSVTDTPPDRAEAAISTTQGIQLQSNSPRLQACIAALLFAAHPIHTEAVAGVVGHAEVLSAALAFAALLAFITAAKCACSRQHLLYLLLAVGLLWTATLAKEIGITMVCSPTVSVHAYHTATPLHHVFVVGRAVRATFTCPAKHCQQLEHSWLCCYTAPQQIALSDATLMLDYVSCRQLQWCCGMCFCCLGLPEVDEALCSVLSSWLQTGRHTGWC